MPLNGHLTHNIWYCKRIKSFIITTIHITIITKCKISFCRFCITQCHLKHHVHLACVEQVQEDEDSHCHKYHKYVFDHARSSYVNYSYLDSVISVHTTHKQMVLNLYALTRGLSILPFLWILYCKLGIYAFDVSLDHDVLYDFVNLFDCWFWKIIWEQLIH